MGEFSLRRKRDLFVELEREVVLRGEGSRMACMQEPFSCWEVGDRSLTSAPSHMGWQGRGRKGWRSSFRVSDRAVSPVRSFLAPRASFHLPSFSACWLWFRRWARRKGTWPVPGLRGTRIRLASKMTSLIRVFRPRKLMQNFMMEYVSAVKKFLNGVWSTANTNHYRSLKNVLNVYKRQWRILTT